MALATRMRSDGTWGNATVLNMSSRGVMIRTPAPIRVGVYLEIRRGTDLAIVGRVVWSSGAYAGVRAQDAIDVNAITCSGSTGAKPAGTADRRSTKRRTESPAAQAERSRQIGTLVQYGAMVAAVVFAAMIAASFVNDVLASAFRQVSQAL